MRSIAAAACGVLDLLDMTAEVTVISGR